MHIKRCAFVFDGILNGRNSIKRYVDASVNVPVTVFLCRPNVKQYSAVVCFVLRNTSVDVGGVAEEIKQSHLFLLTALLQFALSICSQQPDFRVSRF